MKKIFILLISLGAFASVFAQSQKTEEARDIILGRKKTTKTQSPRDIILGKDDPVYNP
ncbi:MAG: hypothetical protein ICV66_05255, partial [Chitinophagaceae bacterium]|nr:hypothetical protein [Chitinophagaceae bacterium]